MKSVPRRMEFRGEPPCKICSYEQNYSKTEAFCITCNITMCSICTTKHKSLFTNDNHVVLSAKYGIRCQIHTKEYISIYCNTCNVPICVVCSMIKCSDHVRSSL